MTADPSNARDLLDHAIELGDGGSPADFDEWRETARVALRVALGPHDDTVARFNGIRYGLPLVTEGTPQAAFDKARRTGVLKAIALLRAARMELDVRRPAPPGIDVNALHPWVAGMAASLWSEGHHRQAVEEAARAVEVQLRAKLHLDGGTGGPLVTSAFSPKDPKPGEPRLRFYDFRPGTENWTNAHEGAMSFGRGCMMRVRNLYSHGHEPDDQEALEALAALSLLAR